MINPKVSICVPAYNQPEFLKRNLRSIVTQSYNNYEIIITDDSPGDLVENAVKEFHPNPKLTYYRNRKRLGSPENWNQSIRHATGEYIKVLHHDDWFSERDSIAKFVKALDHNPGADFAFSSCLACDITGNVKFIYSANEKQLSSLRQSPFNLYPENFIGAPSVTFFRNKINKFFDPLLRWAVDIDFYINVLSSNKNFVFLPEPLISINSGSDNQVTSECVNSKDVEIFEWLYLFFKLKTGFKLRYKNIKFIYALLNKHKVRSLVDLHRLKEAGKLSKVIIVMMYFKNLFLHHQKSCL